MFEEQQVVRGVENQKTRSGNVFSSDRQITYVEGEGSGQDAVTDGEDSGKVDLSEMVVPVIAGVLLIGIIVWLLTRKKSKDKDKE